MLASGISSSASKRTIDDIDADEHEITDGLVSRLRAVSLQHAEPQRAASSRDTGKRIRDDQAQRRVRPAVDGVVDATCSPLESSMPLFSILCPPRLCPSVVSRRPALRPLPTALPSSEYGRQPHAIERALLARDRAHILRLLSRHVCADVVSVVQRFLPPVSPPVPISPGFYGAPLRCQFCFVRFEAWCLLAALKCEYCARRCGCSTRSNMCRVCFARDLTGQMDHFSPGEHHPLPMCRLCFGSSFQAQSPCLFCQGTIAEGAAVCTSPRHKAWLLEWVH